MEELARKIRERIRAQGPIPFACFMEKGLYYPGLGYYASGGSRRRAGADYYTSPQAHPVFGALLALQLEQMWQVMERPAPFHVVEAGAGEGRLARDILDYSWHLEAGFRQALFYVAVDVEVGAVLEPPLRAIASRGLPFRGLRGCILSNELLDALPVHRLVVRGGSLKEVYVALEGEAFVETLGELSAPVRDLLEAPDSLPPEGSHLEICPSAWAWMGEAGQALETGFVLTIDYGYGEASGEGTLASYRRHAAASPYQMVGQQDLTAHVDFGAVIEAGRRAGLKPLSLVSQRRFLTGLGLEAFREAAARLRLPQRQHQANQMAMLDLVRPEGLGSFGVLVQCKGVRGVRMSDLAPERPAQERLAAGELPVPLLSPEHLPLLEGRYPHLAWDLE